jgi:hypothetical protein
VSRLLPGLLKFVRKIWCLLSRIKVGIVPVVPSMSIFIAVDPNPLRIGRATSRTYNHLVSLSAAISFSNSDILARSSEMISADPLIAESCSLRRFFETAAA